MVTEHFDPFDTAIFRRLPGSEWIGAGGWCRSRYGSRGRTGVAWNGWNLKVGRCNSHSQQIVSNSGDLRWFQHYILGAPIFRESQMVEDVEAGWCFFQYRSEVKGCWLWSEEWMTSKERLLRRWSSIPMAIRSSYDCVPEMTSYIVAVSN